MTSDPPHPLVAPAHTPTPRTTTPKAHTMTLNIAAMIDHHERLREERASDAIAQLAPTPKLTPLANHARDRYLLAKARQRIQELEDLLEIAENNYRIEHLLSALNRHEGCDMATTRLRHLGPGQ